MSMKKNPKVYNQIGHVKFPIYSDEYHDLATLKPEEAGILTVRLLIEDTTLDGRHKVLLGPQPARDDFIVGCDKFKTAKEAHEYFSGDRKIIDNILLGVIDWSGVKLVPGSLNVVEFFRCLPQHLDDFAKNVYRQFEHVKYPGCQLWLVTSLDRQRETVEALMQEVEYLRYDVEKLPRVLQEPVICRDCEAKEIIKVKPHISARRIGWKKIKPRYWRCPECVAEAAKLVN